LAFDYVLYLGCLLLAIELGYLEFRFHILRESWEHYLLVSAAVFFTLAYRFDNRFVLSLALSTLAGWFGLRLSSFPGFGDAALRGSALIYGSIVAVASFALFRAGIKKHFFDAYLHIAGNVIFVALLSALLQRDAHPLYLAALIALSALTIFGGARFGRFAFVVYGILYGYLGLSAQLLRHVGSSSAALTYIAVSSTIVIVSLVTLARRLGREE
jgi:hypothetical protein